MGLSESLPNFNLIFGSMEQSSKINDASTKAAVAMPNILITAAPDTSGTENLLASSPLTKDTLVTREAQEAIPSSISSMSPELDEGSQTSTANGESEEDEGASLIYHDAAESIRSSSSAQTAFLVGRNYSLATESIRSSSTVQTAFLVGPTYSDAVESLPSSSLSERNVSVGSESPTAENSSDGNLEVVSSDVNSLVITHVSSRHLDRHVCDVSTRTSSENPTTPSTHYVGGSSSTLNVEKPTLDFDVQVTNVESDHTGLLQARSDPSLTQSVAPARSKHDQNDGSGRKMTICKRIKAFFSPRKQPKVFFHLIRHGEAYHNLGHERGLNHKSFSIIDPSLTQLGVQQALSLNQHISSTHPTPTLILMSPLVRAIETALLVYPPGETGTHNPRPQYIAYDDLREHGNHPCNKRAELGALQKRYAGRGVDLRLLSEEAPAMAENDTWARADKVQREILRIAEILKSGGGYWRGVELRRGEEAGRDIHVVVVSHGSFLKRLLGIGPGPQTRSQFVPTELRSCELNAKGGLVETRESLKLRQARRIIAGL